MCEGLFDTCGTISSNYEPKARAIEGTLHHLSDNFTHTEKHNNIIFSDAKSVLEALENDDSKDKTIRKLLEKLSLPMASTSPFNGSQGIQTYRETKELIPLLKKCKVYVYNKITPLPLPRPNRQSNNTKQRIGGKMGKQYNKQVHIYPHD